MAGISNKRKKNWSGWDSRNSCLNISGGGDSQLQQGKEGGNALGRTRTSSNCILPTEMLMVTSSQLSRLSKQVRKTCLLLPSASRLALHYTSSVFYLSRMLSVRRQGIWCMQKIQVPSAQGSSLPPQHICSLHIAALPVHYSSLM